MDDLDELLDEVERTFCPNVSVAASSRADSNKVGKFVKDDDRRKKRSASKAEEPVNDEDIDALLEDLLEEDHKESPRPKSGLLHKGSRAEKKLPSQPGGSKCCPVFLGGSAVANGVGMMMSKRSCDQLRCTSCDFRVLMFDDCEWDASCDYLFFRNNMPERQKLRAKLKRRRGSRSYACQCSWFTATETADLRDHRQLRWVCGKHKD